jgi:hypothetical protein
VRIKQFYEDEKKLRQLGMNAWNRIEELEAVLAEIASGTYLGTSLTPDGPRIEVRKRMTRKMMMRKAGKALARRKK